jgi:hypothetical protein
MKFLNNQQGGGARAELVSPDGSTYQMFRMKNREIAFDVDLSSLWCGQNGALYFSAMSPTGTSNNADVGAGYCDAQGQGVGSCQEMDIWEANSDANALTTHSCGGTSRACDKGGCSWNPYREGAHSFYGPSMQVDTTQPMTVITQFYTNDNSDSGTLSQISRIYIQNGKVIQNPQSNKGGNSITDAWCAKSINSQWQQEYGGLEQLGTSFDQGMVLVVSLWNSTSMGWLDGYPNSGRCTIENNNPKSFITFGNLKFGAIGATYNTSSASV